MRVLRSITIYVVHVLLYLVDVNVTVTPINASSTNSPMIPSIRDDKKAL